MLKVKKWIISHLKILWRFSILVALIIFMYSSWALYQQDIEQLFWETSRTTIIIGFLFLVIGWSFWEFYASTKKNNKWIIWTGIIGIVGILTSVVLINSILGLVGGALALILIILFLLAKEFKMSILLGGQK